MNGTIYNKLGTGKETDLGKSVGEYLRKKKKKSQLQWECFT
jgi:hypothetical protein